MSDYIEKLKHAKELFEAGVYSEAEYETKKAEYLEALGMNSSSLSHPGQTDPNLGPTIERSDSRGTVNSLGSMTQPSGKHLSVTSPNQNAGTMMNTVIGNYQILSSLGEGGMGSVFRGRHTLEEFAAAEGDVAIKMIHPSLATDPAFRTRFIKEAAFGKKLIHPNIADVISIYHDQDTLALMMEFIEGEELYDLIPSAGMSVEEVVTYLTPIASALDYLHSQGVVHRDMKPANIRVRPDGTPVILDFGIAKDINEADNEMTQTGTAMGTQAYMAPEQMDAKRVTGAADQYALAMMAYQMLSGTLPWESGISAARVTIVKMMGQVQPLKDVADVSDTVSNAVMKGLSLQPDQRFATCMDFIEAFESNVIPHIVGKIGAGIIKEKETVDKRNALHQNAIPQTPSNGQSGRTQIIAPNSTPTPIPSIHQTAPPQNDLSGRTQIIAPNTPSSTTPSSTAKLESATSAESANSSSNTPTSNTENNANSKLGIGVAALLLLGVGVWQMTKSSEDTSNSVDVQEDMPSLQIKEIKEELVWIEASNVTPGKNTTYRPSNLVDGLLNTPWQAGTKKNDGVGEFLILHFDRPMDITKLEIANGFQRPESFERNVRAKNILIEDVNGHSVLWNLADAKGFQSKDVDFKNITNLKLNVTGVYKSKYHEVCISELKIWGKPAAAKSPFTPETVNAVAHKAVFVYDSGLFAQNNTNSTVLQEMLIGTVVQVNFDDIQNDLVPVLNSKESQGFDNFQVLGYAPVSDLYIFNGISEFNNFKYNTWPDSAKGYPKANQQRAYSRQLYHDGQFNPDSPNWFNDKYNYY